MKASTKNKNSFKWKKLTPQQYQEFIDIKRHWKKWEDKHQTLYMAIGLCVSLLFVNAAFMWKTQDTQRILEFSRVDSDLNELIDIPLSKQPPPPPPKKTVDLFVIKEVEEEVIEEIEVNLDVEINEQTTIEDIVYEAPSQEEDADELFTVVEKFPAPAGGMKAFNEYLSKNIKYPKSAMRLGISGRVFLKFVVERDGSLTDIRVVKGVGGGCDKEAIRVLSSAPAWEPGKQRGRPVRVSMILPITFVMR
ncbi:MAG: energy transducer TonB [Cyclobacteriaceae bacterium]